MRKKHATEASVFNRVPLYVSFIRTLIGHTLTLWHDLVARMSHVHLNYNVDVFRWRLNQSSMFTVSLIYSALISNAIIQFDKYLWKLKMPLKLKHLCGN